MTACTNNGGKARRVVTAALVGVLSVGAVPAIALATGADVSLQSVTGEQGIEKGTVTGAVNVNNEPVNVPESGVITFTADGEPQAAIPTQVTFAAGTETLTVDLNKFDYDVEVYNANSDFTVNSTAGALPGFPVSAGKYVTKLTLTSGYPNADIYLPFEIKAGSVDDVTAVAADGSFEFDGNDQLDGIKFKVGDMLLDLGDFESWNLNYRKGSSYSWQTVDEAKWAGDYSIVLVGKAGTAFAGTETEVQFTVTPLDLEQADVVLADDTISNMVAVGSSSYVPTIVSINGKAPSADLASRVKLTFKSGPKDSWLVKGTGVYTYTISAIDGTDQVVKSQDVTMVATDATVAPFNFKYQGNSFSMFNGSTINLGEGQSFTPDKIEVFDNTGKKLGADEYTLSATNVATGATTTDLSRVNTPGTWVVTARVNAEKNGYILGGFQTMTVTTISGEITADANIYFIYDGKLVSGSHSVDYDGTDKYDDLKVVVTDTYGNVLAAGKDYTVTAYDEAGNALDEIVDAGDYTIEVASDSYRIDETTDSLALTVDPVTVSDVRVSDGAFQVYGKDAFIPYTGSAIEPAIEYKGADGKWYVLPSELYTLTFTRNDQYSTDATHSYKKVDDMVEEGYYKIYLHKSRGYEGNWTISGGTQGFLTVGNSHDSNGVVRVTASRLFPDVPTDEWYSQSVYDAVNLGYMNGDGASGLFNPSRELTRAEAVCILFNMAGGNDLYKDGMFEYDADHGFETGYTDVDGTQFYAKAAAWAELTGIVNGYADGTFGVSRKVTNEEFACMLANLAKAKGEDVSVEDADAVLAGYPDAGLVSDWAKEAVAWAVQEGVMGNGPTLSPAGSILRMRAATMVVNYQPEGVFDSVFEFESQEQGE